MSLDCVDEAAAPTYVYCTTFSRCYPKGYPPPKSTPQASEINAVEPQEELHNSPPNVDVSFDPAARWINGSTLRIGLRDASARQTSLFIGKIDFWMKRSGANLQLQYVIPDATCDMIVTFDPNANDWSYIGRFDCRNRTSQNLASMNLSSCGDTVDEQTCAGYIWHEFGHALGLVHEHQTQAAQQFIQWNRVNLYPAMQRINSWDQTATDQNMITVTPGITTLGGFDRLSVMMYEIQPTWTTNGFSQPGNYNLSAQDIAGLGQIYPQRAPQNAERHRHGVSDSMKTMPQSQFPSSIS